MQSSKTYVLIATTLGCFLIPFMGSAINLTLPAIEQEFGMNAILLSWIATSYLIAASVFLLPFGRLADIYGMKRIFTYGIVLFIVSSLMSALATSSAMLIASRALQGIGGAMIFGNGVALLTSVFPANERGKALGINVASIYVALSIGPLIGGVLTQHFGWRSIFIVNVPLGLIVLALITWKLKGEWSSSRGERFDLSGSIIYGIALIALIYGLTRLPEITGILLILAGAAALFAFIKWEARAKTPILDVRLFRTNVAFAFSNLAALINYAATFAVAFLLSLYLQYIKGLDPQHTGIILITQPVVQAFLSPLAGKLSDRFEARLIASAGMVITAIGLALFTFINGSSSIEFVIIGQVVLGLGFALFSSPNTNAIMGSVDNRIYGVASATLATMRQMGMTFSMGVVMVLFAIHMGHVQILPENHEAFLYSIRLAFIIFACLCFAGIFASLARGKTRRE